MVLFYINFLKGRGVYMRAGRPRSQKKNLKSVGSL